MRRGMRALLTLMLLIVPMAASAADYASIPGGRFRSVLPLAPGNNEVTVKSFALARTPVTNAQFLAFVRARPQWQRGRIPAIFADASYLKRWAAAGTLGAAAPPAHPVTDVSWFAAAAYCEARGERLPTWYEWEYAAAAGAATPDARDDPAWRQQMLDWYAQPGGADRDVGTAAPNYYGVQDLHGLVWEWVSDFGALMVSGDNREQGDPDLAKFCGSGALTLEQKENYAVQMRIALLSSLQARYTTANLGFRCAQDEETP
jgi:formylglycine-generating enzyme required for sulfatase activity